MAQIYIDSSDFIEAVCRLTELSIHEVLEFHYEDKGIVTLEDGSTAYTDSAQELFNVRYDEIEEIINSVLKVYQNF